MSLLKRVLYRDPKFKYTREEAVEVLAWAEPNKHIRFEIDPNSFSTKGLEAAIAHSRRDKGNKGNNTEVIIVHQHNSNGDIIDDGKYISITINRL